MKKSLIFAISCETYIIFFLENGAIVSIEADIKEKLERAIRIEIGLFLSKFCLRKQFLQISMGSF